MKRLEANKIVGKYLEVASPQTFVNMEDIKQNQQKILTLTPGEARKLEVKHRS